MRKIIKTIEEYEEAINNSEKKLSIDLSNKDLFKRAINDVHNNNKEAASEIYKFKKYKKNYVYKLNTEFNFGKHKRNELSYVYKCDPYYIEWCMLNASGVIIYPNSLQKLINEKVFNVDDLLNFSKYIGEDTLEINLSKFVISENNFPSHHLVKEERFFFSKEAIIANNEKLEIKMEAIDFIKGGNWGKERTRPDKRLIRKSIIIIK